MPRVRSEKVSLLKAKLIARITDGFHRPGDRFLSARAVADRYGLSYQTAHFLIQELAQEGFLERRPASGTYVAGQANGLKSVELWFHARAKRSDSFGDHLLKLLRPELERHGIKYRLRWASERTTPDTAAYPVLWEAPLVTEKIVQSRRYALLLNDRPAPGLASSLLDAVATDDFSAGVCAAQVLAGHGLKGNRLAVVGGPQRDHRSKTRIAGFLSEFPAARVINAGGWFFENAARMAGKILATEAKGIFCVNDRLAAALLAHCRRRGIKSPLLVGHDNAPVAEELHLTSIETPWEQMVSAALAVIQARLAGDSSPARQVILAQRPVRRLTA